MGGPAPTTATTYELRVLLETVEGNKTSYISSSFVNTDVDLVLSASQVYNRITGSTIQD